MKKYFIFLILISVFLSGCIFENKVIGNDNSIKFTVPDEFHEYFPYEEIPEFVLEFEGTVYTNINASTENKKVFNKNDDFYLSDIIAGLLNEYEDRIYYRLLTKETATETKMNNLVADQEGNLKHKTKKIAVVDGEIFNEMAYIRLANGLQLSVEYRRFKSDFTGEEKTYYSWQKTRPLNMVLHYPLFLNLKENNQKELLLIPLPDKIIYRLGISSQIPLEKIIKDKSFLGDFYKTYPYPDYTMDPREGEEFDLETNIKKVKDFYFDSFDGRYEGDDFCFTYMQKDFVVFFNNEDFKIDIYNK